MANSKTLGSLLRRRGQRERGPEILTRDQFNRKCKGDGIGFTKKDDLRYFTKAICKIDYVRLPELAPTAEILDPYKKAKNGDWQVYEHPFLNLMPTRQIESTVSREVLDGGFLLCSEEKPHHCHRRLAAEYLKEHWRMLKLNTSLSAPAPTMNRPQPT